MNRLETCFVVLLLTAACGDDDVETDGGMDAAALDAGADAGGTPADAGVDGPDSAASPDSGPEPCDENGAVRSAACGNCGMGQERCEAGAWVLQDTCLNQGECAAGTLEVEELSMCGERARLCTDACEWGPFDETREPGECEAAEIRTTGEGCEIGENMSQTCSDECEWESATCVSPCGVLRTEPWQAEEVCVPAGMFMRGDPDFADSPLGEVFLSTYAIDRYLVTVQRFRECRDDGGCTASLNSFEREQIENTALIDHAFLGSVFHAQEFCAWDGRRLQSSAQFEKAMRGPAPRAFAYPWGSDTWDCDVYPTIFAGCPGAGGPYRGPIGVLDGDEGYYGAEEGAGWEGEWTRTRYAADYYDEPSSLTNPEGPAMGEHELRDFTRGRHRIGARRTTDDLTEVEFRCVREIEE